MTKIDELIKQLTEKISDCDTRTKSGRMVKGAYVDALMMVKKLSIEKGLDK